jgi:diadenosine tetraphosphate (Ap4A) HIT family hydrolase
MSCSICKHGEPALEIARTERWVLRHHGNSDVKPAPRLGWLLLDSIRHDANDVSAMDDDEAAELGIMLRRASALIKSVTQCDRVYIVSFNEAHHHYHAHLIPRHADDDETKAWAVGDLYRRLLTDQRPQPLPVSAEQIEKFVDVARATWPTMR